MKNRIIFPLLFTVASFSTIYGQMRWQPTNSQPGFTVSSFLSHGDTLYAGMLGAGIFLTWDEGHTWEKCAEGLESPFITSIIRKGEDLYAATLGGGVYRSENRGNTWMEVNDSSLHKRVWSLASQRNRLYAGAEDGVYVSEDEGKNWEKLGLPPPVANHQIIFSLAVSGNKIIAGSGGHVYLSEDQGRNWEQIALDTRFSIQTLLIDRNKIYAGSSGNGVFMSENGRSWQPVLRRNGQRREANAHSLVFVDTSLTIGAAIQGVFNDDQELNDGFGEPQVKSLAFHQGKLYAGTFSEGIWKYDLVQRESRDLTSLTQSPGFTVFPNPVNQSTVMLQYTLPHEGQVEIALYNASGVRLKEIVKAYQDTGAYAISYEVGTLAGGTYYFSFKTGQTVQTKQIIVIER